MIKKLATKEEAKECDNLLTMLIKDEHNYNNALEETFTVTDFFINIINREEEYIYIDIEDDKVVGFIRVSIIKEKGSETIALIKGLYVLNSYRKKGIASNLLNKVINLINEKKIKFIDVNVMALNKDAINLYKKFGFDNLSFTYRKEIK